MGIAPELDYELMVEDDAGKEPPRTELGIYLLHPTGGSSMLSRLMPQEEERVVFEVTRVYQLTKPGNYIARFQRAVMADSEEQGKAFAERAFSPPIPFKIIE